MRAKFLIWALYFMQISLHGIDAISMSVKSTSNIKGLIQLNINANNKDDDDDSSKDITNNIEYEPIFPLAPQPQPMAKALAQANANRMKTIEDNMSLSEIVRNRFKQNI